MVKGEDVRLLLSYGDPHAFEDEEGVDHVLVCAAELLATGEADHHAHDLLLDAREHELAPILLRSLAVLDLEALLEVNMADVAQVAEGEVLERDERVEVAVGEAVDFPVHVRDVLAAGERARAHVDGGERVAREVVVCAGQYFGHVEFAREFDCVDRVGEAIQRVQHLVPYAASLFALDPSRAATGIVVYEVVVGDGVKIVHSIFLREKEDTTNSSEALLV